MKLALTGSSGFIGSHLSETLRKRGTPFYSITREELGRTCPIPHLSGSEPTFIFHLAGQSKVNSEITFESYFEANVLTTHYLLENLKRSQARFILFFSSSVHVYGNQYLPISEGSPLLTHSFYGFTKFLCEQMILSWWEDRGRRDTVLIGRLANVIGPRQGAGFLVPDWIEKLQKKPAQVDLENAEAQRSFVSIEDICALFMIFVDFRWSKKLNIFNLVGEKTYSVRQVIEMLCKLMKTKPKINYKKGDNPFQGQTFLSHNLNSLFSFKFESLEQSLERIVQFSLK